MWLVYSDRGDEVDRDPLLVGAFRFREDADDLVAAERAAGADLAYADWSGDEPRTAQPAGERNHA